MRSTFFILLSTVLSLASYAVAQIMPAIVNEIPETRALWDILHNAQHLPKDYSVPELRRFDHRNWHSFLQRYGDDIVMEGWREAPDGERGSGAINTIQKMRRFVKKPDSKELWLQYPGPKRVAGKLIEAYAKSLKEGDHIYAVNEHLRLPDDADHLFVPEPKK